MSGILSKLYYWWYPQPTFEPFIEQVIPTVDVKILKTPTVGVEDYQPTISSELSTIFADGNMTGADFLRKRKSGEI